MRPMTSTGFRGMIIALLGGSGLLLSGCAGLGTATADAVARQRAEAQSDLARQEATPPPVDADNQATYRQLVTQMQQKGLYFASLAHIEAMQQRWGADPESNLLKAEALRHTNQPQAARALYVQLLGSPLQARAAHGLGLMAGRAGDLPEAQARLLQASVAAPTDVDILNDLGFVLMQQGQHAAAKLPLMKAAELAPGNLRVWSNVTLWLTLDGQTEQASQVMDSRKLPAAARTQIAELARSGWPSRATALVPRATDADTQAAAAPVLSLALSLGKLPSSPPRGAVPPSAGAAQARLE